jgi:hypothetical protein
VRRHGSVGLAYSMPSGSDSVSAVRNAIRAAVVTIGVPLTTLLASPAFAAQHRLDGDDPGPGLTAPETLGLFVGIPGLVIAIVYLLVFAGSGARGPRYRPGVAWRTEPEWWGGPADGERAVESATPTQTGGGARAHW